jgi:predicted phage tail protein
MKKVYLHGELGRRFGEIWDLDVSSPLEAISALCANNFQIREYIQKAHQEGISYGVKKSSGEVLNHQDEFEMSTGGDFHIFPIAQGSQAFAISLITTAITTAASMYVQKQLSKAMERDDSVLQAQTQSFIYTGRQNRFEQGSTVPLGYGRMNVGTNIISSCSINYDFNNEKVKLYNFQNGLYSLVPFYQDPEGYEEYGPLGASFIKKTFDGSSEYRVIDPTFLNLRNQLQGIGLSMIGSPDALYGGNKTQAEIREQIAMMNQCQGDSVVGYYCYSWDWSKGVNPTLLPNFDASTGNWHADTKNIDNQTFAIPPEDAQKNSFVCIQSEPLLETEALGNFYPIFWSEESLDDIKKSLDIQNLFEAFPVEVGQRWINGSKDNGLGWFKLESTSVYKAIDLVCEGSIDGFASKNGSKLSFDKDFKVNEASSSSNRNESDDYLQAVHLDSTPVKEVNYTAGIDSYNINEFDIDVGLNSRGDVGADDQLPLREQYLFSATTKEINARLYGPQAITQTTIAQSETNQFQKNRTYNRGFYVINQENGESVKYKINKNLSNKFSTDENYIYQSELSRAEIVFTGSDTSATFFVPEQGFKNFQDISSKDSFSTGDKIKTQTFDGAWQYYILKNENFLGAYNANTDYRNSIGKLVTKSSSVYKIKPDIGGPGSSPEQGLERLGITIDDRTVFNDMGKILQAEGVVGQAIDITPGSSGDTSNNFWSKISINSPTEVKKDGAQDITRDINLFTLAGTHSTTIEKSQEEENYISHTIINPLVEQAYVSLQIDALSYIYEGDYIKVTYKIGEIWMAMLDIAFAYGVAKFVWHTANATISATEATAFTTAGKLPEAKLAKNEARDHVKDAALGNAMSIAAEEISDELDSNEQFNLGNKTENSGETWPNRAKFRIKYGNEGEVMYSTDVYMYGIATSPYRKDVKLYLPPNPEQKNRTIKVYKLNRERNLVKEGEQAARYKESMSLASITEITPVNLSYPNSVVIGTRVNARDYPNLPERNYHLRLKKVALPDITTYDPETRRYLQNWNGLFMGQSSKSDSVPEEAKRWSDNPAWCLYDLISNKRYGVARFGIKPENIDRWTLYKMAKYCDEYIPTGYSAKYQKREFVYQSEESDGYSIIIQGNIEKFTNEFNHPSKKLAIFYDNGSYDSIIINDIVSDNNKVILKHKPLFDTGRCAVEVDYPLVEPRYTLNAFIMNQSNAFKLINEFASVFRAFSYWQGGTINFFQDEKRSPIMLFSNNNISKDGFSYSSTPKTARANVCKIKYLDKYNDFRPKMEYFEDEDAIKQNNIIEQTVDGFGITSKSQAKRAAEFLIKSANRETELVSFKTSLLGSYLRPGDIIEVLDSKRNIGKFSGKILDISVETDGRTGSIKVDYPISLIIDPANKKTWKKITFYTPSQNHTIESLDAIGSPTDQEIDGLRQSQIAEYYVSEVYENDTRLKLYNSPYEFIEGKYTWDQAFKDAKERGGKLARINNEDEANLMKIILPEDALGWIGGYHGTEVDGVSTFVWHQSNSCEPNDNAIEYFDWAENYPSAGSSDKRDNYIQVQGSTDMEDHGKWIHDDSNSRTGYILEKPFDGSLSNLDGISGTTFVLESNIHFASKKQYKVINITEESKGIFNIQGLQYDIDKFDNIEKEASLTAPVSPVIFTEKTLAPPASVKIEILDEDAENHVPYGLKAIWENDSAAASYRVQFFDTNDLLATFEINNDQKSSEMSYIYRNKRISEGGSYYVRVYSVPN